MRDDGAARPWWAGAVFYQVYLRSFQDGNGDGFGDLDGVIARLDHLVWLGVDALWLSPCHPSPMLDGGYDIADFTGVDARFGTLDTFDRLLAEAKTRGIRVIIDFVPNHTSDQHPWFRESRSSPDNPKRDWYVWADGRDGGPPSNWASMMKGPAWTRDEASGQFYYHAFLPEQPDLNWRNPAVRDAMHDALRFWLARGVDGIRVDAVPHLVEDALLRDDPPGDLDGDGMPDQNGYRHVFTSNRPETLDCVAGLRAVIDEFPDRFLVGEAHLPMALTMRYYGDAAKPGLSMPFNFALLRTAWDARALAGAIDQYLALLPDGGRSNWLLGNHDETRVASRIGSAQARNAAVLVMTLPGASTIYNGEELGLEDTFFSPADLAGVPEMRHPDHALKYAPHRTPVPWNADGPGHGFTAGQPWLAIGHANARRSVEAQRNDPASLLSLYRRLLRLRREYPALAVGDWRPEPGRGTVLAFTRHAAGAATIWVALNIGSEPARVILPNPGTVLARTRGEGAGDPVSAGEVLLGPDEGWVVALGE